MIQKLPTEGFNWVDPSQFTPDNIDFLRKLRESGLSVRG